jgi:hypothetical protein
MDLVARRTRSPWLRAAERLDEQAAAETPLAVEPGPWLADPAGFARDCILWTPGEGLAGYQAEALTAIPQHERVAVRSLHGAGKTTDAAIALLWFASRNEVLGRDWKAPTTAGSWQQLKDYLWPEVHKWAGRLRWDVIGLPPFVDGRDLLDWNLKLPHGHAFAMSPTDAALIEGAHADAILVLFDEAKAIPDGTWDAIEGAFSAAGLAGREAFAFAISTPGEPVGRFYQIHARQAGYEDWWTRHVRLAEAVAAGRVSQQWADARARQWGPGSAVYRNRVEGEFAASDEDGVIPLAWVELANQRWREWAGNGRRWAGPPLQVGVDVARGGEDVTVMATRTGPVIVELARHRREDTMQTTGRVVGIVDALASVGRFIPVVDVIGIGAGVVDRLREQSRPVVAFNAAAGTKLRDKTGAFGFVNCRSAAWWNLREMLEPAAGLDVALPPDDLLTGDLCAPRWRVMSGGRIQVESKEDVRRRLGRSTDTGDAVVQACWQGGGEASFSGMSLASAVLTGR